MMPLTKKFSVAQLLIMSLFIMFASSCSNSKKSSKNDTSKSASSAKYPSDVLTYFDQWKILLGNGETQDNLTDYQNKDFFYSTTEDNKSWIVYKTPNSGTTSKNSSNTRTELHQLEEWVPETGGKLTGTCKVMHVSTSGDARVAASYSVVVGQIHSSEGHENEPLKIFYKKFPGQSKGSVFWNYEINTKGDNKGRWDYSTPVWGHDMAMVGSSADSYPAEPADGILLGESFSYEVNVHKGIMHLTFRSKGHETKTFTKNLLVTEYATKNDIPALTLDLFVPIGQDGVERATAYKGELNYFKQGAYNQTNGKDPNKNMVWCTGSETYGGDIAKQYANGSYTEVWFSNATVGASTEPSK